MLNKIFLSVCMVLMGLSACKKEETLSGNEIMNCHNEQTWTVEDMENTLIGQWDIKSYACPMSVAAIDQDIRAEFKTDGTVVLTGDDATSPTANWTVEDRGNNTFRVNTEPFAWEVYGYEVYICDDEIYFFNSLLDGCDLIYERD